jgi:hypothetical protein
MAELSGLSSAAEVVTEAMPTFAARTGDLERLQVRSGVGGACV